jgi:hypothetical protein
MQRKRNDALGWRVYRTLAALGVPRSVYYAWKRRDGLEDRAGKPCRVYEVLPEERAAICGMPLLIRPVRTEVIFAARGTERFQRNNRSASLKTR